MIDVRVVVLGSSPQSVDGEVDPSVPLGAVKEDIVASLSLGSPEDWLIAVSPQNTRVPMDGYRPESGDTVFLIRAGTARGSSFKRKD
jgi:hypothetical protein